MEETKNMSIWQIMSGYGSIYKRIFASPKMVLSLLLMTIFNITWMVSGSFFGLYVTGTLFIPEHFLAYFPIVRSVIIVLFIYLLQPKLDKFGFRSPMLIGLVIFIASIILLIMTPAGSLPILFAFIVVDAIAYSFVVPRSDSLTQLLIEPSERARINGLMMVIVLGLSIPFGYLAGWLSEMDRRYPFMLIAVFLALMFVIIALNKNRLDAMKKNIAH
jgi:MFS family permease